VLPIRELNEMAPDDFAAAVKPLFEAAAPLAAALYAKRPFASYADLLERAEMAVARMPVADQIAVVNAHPRIGENAEAVRQTSAQSYVEQGYAAEADLPSDTVREVYAALADLNRQYEERFGFRFVVFVNGRPKAEVLEVLRQRLHNSRTTELETALEAMFLIARDRYTRLTADS
jgi:OHCU decarboxylase